MIGIQLNMAYDLLIKDGALTLGETTPQNQALIGGFLHYVTFIRLILFSASILIVYQLQLFSTQKEKPTHL